ncbi:MAG: hypothetical protein M3352_02575 [Bacteroidota bacterium]|nr:hypothetical protein [Bacteroidota bacterium]
MTLAKEKENIDLIIGRHTHIFLSTPVVVRNKKDKEVLINEVGWVAFTFRLNFEFKKESNKN